MAIENHYNAFISYRHAPADSRVAGMVQRSLERYRIPKAIRQETGVNKISRVFRDKEELPITSNLNDDISRALHNSDFLIVICSTVTSQSQWVQKEIETFLQTHGKEKVLTVLVDGEPYDVIPPILLYDDVSRENPDGSVTVERIPLEPLSCDLRGNPKKAMKTELHRMAATLIGCPFDALFQRQRKHRRRVITAALSAVITLLSCLTAYFLWTSVQINRSYMLAEENYRRAEENYQRAEENYSQAQKNLRQAQENQSRYLAEESLALLEEGDRITAVQLALAALPGPGNDRPLIPEAQYALTKSLYAYDDQVRSMASVNVFNHQSGISTMELVGEGTRLWTLDNQRNMYLWDTDSYRLLKRWTGNSLDARGYESLSLIALSEERMLICGSGILCCLDARDGTQLWERKAELAWKSVKPLFGGKEIGFLSAAKDRLYRLDVQTGEEAAACALPEKVNGESGWYDICCDWSEDGRWLVVGARPTSGSTRYLDAQCHVFLYDTEKETWKDTLIPGQSVVEVAFAPSGKVIAVTQSWQDGDILKESGYFKSGKSLFASLYDMTRTVSCIDPQSRKLSWSEDIAYSMLSRKLPPMFYHLPEEDGTEKETLFYCVANKCCYFDMETGKLRALYELPATIVMGTHSGDRANLILENGYYSMCEWNSTHTYGMKSLISEIDRACYRNQKVYAMPIYSAGVGKVYVYTNLPPDENFRAAAGNPRVDLYMDAAADGRYEVILSGNEEYAFRIIDLAENRLVASVSAEKDGKRPRSVKLLGKAGEDFLCFRTGYMDEENALLRIDPKHGTVTAVSWDESRSADMSVYSPEDGKVYYLADDQLGTIDIASGTRTLKPRPLKLEEKDRYDLNVAWPNHAGTAAVCRSTVYADASNKTVQYEIVDLRTGESRVIPVEEQEQLDFQAVYSPDDSRIAVSGKDAIGIFTGDGKPVCRIPLEGRRAQQVFFPDKDTLAVGYGDLELIAYSAATGEMLRKTTLPGLPRARNGWGSTCCITLADGNLLLNTPEYDGILIDPVRWGCIGVVPACMDYLPEQDAFLTKQQTDNQARIGMIPRYSVDMLIREAEELLQGKTLTEDQKLVYGIS